MRVFIANFGRENYLWPECLARQTIATLEAEDERPLRLADNREGYIQLVTGTKSTARGITPTRQVASRWFNLAGILENTAGDLWIHREKDELWWTISRPGGAVTAHLEQAYGDPSTRVYILHKPADAWSKRSRNGTPLLWRALHAKAQTFLFTEATFQELAPENAAYAKALINSEDLDPWHRRQEWEAKAERYKRNAVSMLDAQRATITHMVMAARDTARQANGQQVTRTVKPKEFRFRNPQECEEYLTNLLLKKQEGLCALTGIPLQYYGSEDDPELLCSLDRIDSNRHYEPGNLQIVCRFANRWKNDDTDENFRRLMMIVRDRVVQE